MSNVVGTFVGLELIEERSDPLPCCLDGPLFGFPHEGLQLGEHHLDGVEIGTIGRQEEEVCACGADRLADAVALMAAEIVENDDVARSQGRHESLFDPGLKDSAVHRAVEHVWRDDAVVSQSGQEGQRLPMAMRYLGQVGLAALTPTMCAGHIGLHPGLIDEDQALEINAVLVRLPPRPEPCQLHAILLLGHQRFF